MKRTAYVWMAAMFLLGVPTLPAGAQSDSSLGDYARGIRKDKDKQPASAKKYDNDNLPRNETLSIVGNATEEPNDKPADSATAAPPAGDQSTANSAPKADKPKDSPEERQKEFGQWKDKITAQKSQIDLLGRELDVLQREYRLRAAAFYADAGDRLRNSASWDKEDKQYKQQIADKQKAAEAAKQQLNDMQEQARKAGVPSSMRQ
jgi:hypothetical protein